MCGRFVLVNGEEVFMTFEQIKEAKAAGIKIEEIPPRYNIAPQQKALVVAFRNGELVVENMRWGFVPVWEKEFKTKLSTINARSETLEKSGLYAPSFKSKRCIIPADAFYEWKKIFVEKGVVDKQPMCIGMKDEEPFLFAGLFSIWKDKEEKEFPSFTIITTSPNELMAEIHDRMPVILPEKNINEWLDPDNKDTVALKKLLVSYPTKEMKAYPVSKFVNSPKNDSPECIKPLKAA